MIRWIAKSAPFLAPIPSAFFISRSIYYYLLLNWHMTVPASINLAIAIIAGLSIELLAISSIYLATNLKRWNEYGQVKKEKNPWESAPFGVTLVISLVYLLVAIYLLVVLEAVPGLAQYSTIAFPLLALVGASNLALYQQHQDRLDRYGLTWTFKATPAPKEDEEPKPAPRPARITLRLNPPQRQILATLREQPDLSYQAISDDTGIPKSTVGLYMKQLMAAGYLSKDGNGYIVKEA